MFKPGDKVYYRVNGGWGGGELFQLIAKVVTVHRKKVTIALWNERERTFKFKCVAASNLSSRESFHPNLDKIEY